MSAHDIRKGMPQRKLDRMTFEREYLSSFRENTYMTARSPKWVGLPVNRAGELAPGPPRSVAMQSRAAEYRMHAVVCAAQATAAPDPMKQFYQALELQWVCLAQRAEREAVTSQQDEIAAASQTSKAA